MTIMRMLCISKMFRQVLSKHGEQWIVNCAQQKRTSVRLHVVNQNIIIP